LSIRRRFQIAVLVLATAAVAPAQRGRQQQQMPVPDPFSGMRPREPAAEKLSGTLLRLSLVEMVLLASDRRVIQIEMPVEVKYLRNSEDGHPTQSTPDAFEAGDQVTVQSQRDSMSRYHAVRLQLEKKGDPDEKAAAEQTLEISLGTNITMENFASDGSVDPVIRAARTATFELTKSLPNFIVHQTTTRHVNGSIDLKTKGRKLDVISGNLVTENGEERFQDMLVNGKKPKDGPERNGAWSSGEYSSIIIEVMAPRSKTAFESKGTEIVARRTALRYTFSVNQVHSRWNLSVSGQHYLPGYSGTIWFDEETSRVLRVEMASEPLPKAFPMEKVSTAVGYDFFPLGATPYLLPARADVVTCTRGNGCATNEIEFSGYKKYGAETTISFDKDPR
jgi:hypothetical protein